MIRTRPFSLLRNGQQLQWLSALLSLCVMGAGVAQAPSGIAPLIHITKADWESLIDPAVRPLFTPIQQTRFLSALEGDLPKWPELQNQPGDEHGERLFAWNRKQDERREGHPLLAQPVAFLWSGVLRRFVPEHQGFSVAMGPEFTSTEWGIVRFKPVGLPGEMIAIPSSTLLPVLQDQLAAGHQIHVGIIFIGHLVPNESIMYTFSHEQEDQGMIMPFVQIQSVRYVYDSGASGH